MNIRLKSYLIILATFALGLGTGSLGTYALLRVTLRDMLRGGAHHHGPHGHGDPGQMLERHIKEVTHPDDTQREKLAPILDKYRERLEGQMSKNRHEMESSMLALDSELATVLSPEQMKKWLARPRPPRGMGRGGPDGPPMGPPMEGEGRGDGPREGDK